MSCKSAFFIGGTLFLYADSVRHKDAIDSLILTNRKHRECNSEANRNRKILWPGASPIFPYCRMLSNFINFCGFLSLYNALKSTSNSKNGFTIAYRKILFFSGLKFFLLMDNWFSLLSLTACVYSIWNHQFRPPFCFCCYPTL